VRDLTIRTSYPRIHPNHLRPGGNLLDRLDLETENGSLFSRLEDHARDVSQRREVAQAGRREELVEQRVLAGPGTSEDGCRKQPRKHETTKTILDFVPS